jgi:hypothetical protein
VELTAFRGGVVFELKERMLEVTKNSRESHNTLRRV